MAQENVEAKSRLYPMVVTVTGIALWLAAAGGLLVGSEWREQLPVLALLPLVVLSGMFNNTLLLPSGLKMSQEKMNFTLSDALVLLIACRYGFIACVFVAGVEGFISSRRAVRRLSSNLYSFGMMSLASGAAAVTLLAVLRYGFGATAGSGHALPAVAIAVLAASVVHISVNTAFVAVLFAARLGVPVMSSWKEHFRLAVPMFLPTSAAASLMYTGLQYNALTVAAIGAPILIAIHLGHRRYRDSVQEQLDLVEQAQRERIALTEKAHRETIEALAVTINAKDEVTHEHVLRVQIYAAGVARLLGCSDAEVEALRAGALLHDIGKIAVPDYILNKPGKLTAAEFEKMKTHTLVGAQILGRVGFPYPVVPVVRHHHERWDGRGYPDGLKGDDIPLTARILSVVDCFDAVREDRQYRKAMTREEAINFIMEGSGAMYDPRVVGTFVTHLPEFEAEIMAHRGTPLPTFGIEPVEHLSEAARLVAPAAGLAEAPRPQQQQSGDPNLTDEQRASLSGVALALGAARDRREALASFTNALGAAVPFDLCAVTLVPPHADEAVVAHADGPEADSLNGRRVVPGEGVTGWVVANRQPFYNADPRLDLPPALAERGDVYRTLAACPVMHEGELQGVVTLYSESRLDYAAAHSRILEEASGLLASALSSDPRFGPASAPSHARAEAFPSSPRFDGPAVSPSDIVIESELAH